MRMENKLIHQAAENLASRFNRYMGKEGLELQKLVLGLEIMIINVSKFIIIYLAAFLLGTLWQTVVLHVGYMLVKRYSFGLHALNSTICTLVSCTMFVFIPRLLQGVGVNSWVVLTAFVPIIVCLYLYAPADTKARPILGAKLRARLKRKSVVCGMVLLVIALIVPDSHVKLLLILSAAYQCMGILPITYKLLKRSVRNYETYERGTA